MLLFFGIDRITSNVDGLLVFEKRPAPAAEPDKKIELVIILNEVLLRSPYGPC